MANIEEAIRRLQFLYETHGAEEVAAAQRAITASTEKTEKASLSLERTFNNQEKSYFPLIRAQEKYQRTVEVANNALKQNPALQERANALINAAQAQYIAAAQGVNKYGNAVANSSQLARHEMINLSRQIQDVGVSLVSGQSPFMVLAQQGTQIADVFATSSGTVMGFFRQTASWAAGFATSAAGIATGVAAIGAAWVIAGVQFKSGQNDIERALSGIGAASGVTSKQINEIASASSSAFGLSTSQAREAATAFAATGRIYADNVKLATSAVSDFVKATGTDATDATKKLAAAMLDPAAGAVELNKQFNFLDATQLNYIRSLQAAGKEQEAQKALMDALIPRLQKMAEHTSLAGKAWDVAANAASNFWQYAGKAAPLGPSIPAPWEKVADPKQDQLKLMSTDADAAARSIVGVTAQIEVLQQQLAKLAQYRQAINGPETAAEQIGNVRLQQLYDQNNALVLQAQYVQQIAAQYPGMSIEVAKQLDLMNRQLDVAKARGGIETLMTQQAADFNAARARGLSLEEAMAEAAKKREITEANAKKSIDDQVSALEDQIKLIQARINGTEAATKAEIAYKNALKIPGATEADAQRVQGTTQRLSDLEDEEKIRKQVIASADAQANSEQEAAAAGKARSAAQQEAWRREAQAADDAAESQRELNAAVGWGTDGIKHYGWEIARVTMQTYQMIDAFEMELQAMRNLSFADRIDARLRMMGPSQFDAGGYTSTYDPLGLQTISETGKVTVTSRPLNDTELAQWVGQMDVSSSAAIQKSLQDVFGQFSGADLLTPVNRLIEAAQPDQQASLIQQTIDQIRARETPSLATEETIRTLNDKLEQLTGSTDSLNSTIQGALSPFYSQDPRTTKLGFRAGVVGNPDWMTGATNANPLVAVLGAGATAPGMANGGSFMVGGGYSANDNKMAVFPVASGEEVVVNRNAGSTSGQVVNIDNRIIVTGTVSGDTLSKMKVSRYQQSQRMSRGLAQA